MGRSDTPMWGEPRLMQVNSTIPRILGMKKENAEKVCRDAVGDVGDERCRDELCRVWCNL